MVGSVNVCSFSFVLHLNILKQRKRSRLLSLRKGGKKFQAEVCEEWKESVKR